MEKAASEPRPIEARQWQSARMNYPNHFTITAEVTVSRPLATGTLTTQEFCATRITLFRDRKEIPLEVLSFRHNVGKSPSTLWPVIPGMSVPKWLLDMQREKGVITHQIFSVGTSKIHRRGNIRRREWFCEWWFRSWRGRFPFLSTHPSTKQLKRGMSMNCWSYQSRSILTEVQMFD